jgi:zinc/manganese transport system substrate-binding protein/manganese/iron transport system substrate-binding protein
MSRLTVLAAPLLIVLSLAACGDDDSSGSTANIRVVTTISLLEDLIHEIGGDRVEVTSLLPAGADPHTYEPTPGQVRDITEADVVFANGLNLEPGALKVIEPNLPDGTPLVELAEQAIDDGFPTIEGDEEDEPINPHLWLSVDAAREYVKAIRDALSEADPDGAASYEANYDSYVARLDELDTEVEEALSDLPAERRKLVTTHDAFGYMAAYMGLEVAAVVAESPGQEPSASDVAALVEEIERLGMPAVFEEPQLGAEAGVLEQAAEDAGVEVCTLYSDALDDEVSTYLELIRHNAEEVARCLTG